MPHELHHSDKQTLRHAVRRVLATRAGTALSARQIVNRAAQEVDFKIDDDDVLAALAVLTTMLPPQTVERKDELGPGSYFQATAAGILAYEREGRKRPPG